MTAAVVQAEALARLSEGGPSAKVQLAHMAVPGYAASVPLYWQEGVRAREEADLGRSVMPGRVGRFGLEHGEPAAAGPPETLFTARKPR